MFGRGVVVMSLLAMAHLECVPGLGAQVSPAGTARSASPADGRPVSVHVNGRALTPGTSIRNGESEEIWIAMGALQRALDGDAPSGPSRLRLEGNRLFAIGLGGCAECPARVARAVLLSNRARTFGGVVHLPLEDVVTAFEGRLESDARRGVYGIYVGRCTWCILEPR